MRFSWRIQKGSPEHIRRSLEMEDRGEPNFGHAFEVRENDGQNEQEEGCLCCLLSVIGANTANL
jgi:hypothetical protein